MKYRHLRLRPVWKQKDGSILRQILCTASYLPLSVSASKRSQVQIYCSRPSARHSVFVTNAFKRGYWVFRGTPDKSWAGHVPVHCVVDESSIRPSQSSLYMRLAPTLRGVGWGTSWASFLVFYYVNGLWTMQSKIKRRNHLCEVGFSRI